MIVFSVLLLQRWFHLYYLQNMSVQYLGKMFWGEKQPLHALTIVDVKSGGFA